MAICIVKTNHQGWRKGDHIEAFNSRLQELISRDIVTVIVPDKEPPKKENVEYVRINGCYVKKKDVK